MLRYSFILFFIAVKKRNLQKEQLHSCLQWYYMCITANYRNFSVDPTFCGSCSSYCVRFFGYIFTTGQSNKANRVKLLKFSYIHEFQPFRPLFLFFKLYLAGYEKSVNDHLQLCPGHWLGHSKQLGTHCDWKVCGISCAACFSWWTGEVLTWSTSIQELMLLKVGLNMLGRCLADHLLSISTVAAWKPRGQYDGNALSFQATSWCLCEGWLCNRQYDTNPTGKQPLVG